MIRRGLFVPLTLIVALVSDAWAQGSVALSIAPGFTLQGTATAAWREAVRHRYTDALLDSVTSDVRPPGPAERAWHDLIAKRRPSWEQMVDSLRVPFGATRPPDTVTVLLGLHGGNDAFVHAPSTICFDLGRLQKEYGDAGIETNRDRIDRFFAHEFTHILHKAWAREHGVSSSTPIERALWECLAEGLGNYRSLTARWVLPGGRLTPHARSVLDRLEPVFVERLAALAKASPEEENRLVQGLSEGPFDQKWGALTVALWLAQETRWGNAPLRPWIEAGPGGVIDLARKYIAIELRSQLPEAPTKR